MSKKELRAYVLAHRADDEAFYAYVDKIHEATATAEVAVFEWLQLQNHYQVITKISESSSRMIMKDPDGHHIGVKVQIMRSSLPTHKPLIELVIEDMMKDNQTNFIGFMTVFVSKDETNAIKLEGELVEANFDSRANSSRIVGYINLEGKFQNI